MKKTAYGIVVFMASVSLVLAVDVANWTSGSPYTNANAKITIAGTASPAMVVVDVVSNNVGKIVGSNITANGSLTVAGATAITGPISSTIVSNALGVVYGSNVTVKGTLAVTGVSTFSGHVGAGVISNATGVVVGSNATFNGTLAVTGVSTLSGHVSATVVSNAAMSKIYGPVATAVISNMTVNGAVSGSVNFSAVTTSATEVGLYDPTFIGQVLCGGWGVGTNGIWIAVGLTTNDWVQVSP